MFLYRSFGGGGRKPSFDRSTNKSYTYTAGVSAFGVGLSAQSGYSCYVTLRWAFGDQTITHYLIGANAYITTAAIIYSD